MNLDRKARDRRATDHDNRRRALTGARRQSHRLTDRALAENMLAQPDDADDVMRPQAAPPITASLRGIVRQVGVAWSGRSLEVLLTVQVRQCVGLWPEGSVVFDESECSATSADGSRPHVDARTVRAVIEPGTAIDGQLGNNELSWLSLNGIEKQIARLVSYGKTNHQIAKLVVLSPHTVNYHLRRIFQKLDIQSRSQLAAIVPQR
jgi:DNA-binding CsgD family transcriptional regulator